MFITSCFTLAIIVLLYGLYNEFKISSTSKMESKVGQEDLPDNKGSLN